MRLYTALVLRRPWLPLLLVLLATVALGRLVPRFDIDASAESLLLENDPSIVAYDRSHVVFGSDDYVMIAFTRDDLFTDECVAHIQKLSEIFKKINGVENVLSITEVPLFKSPPPRGGLLALLLASKEPITLTSKRCDRKLAKEELLHHAIWRRNLLSADGRTTLLLVYFKVDPELAEMQRHVFELSSDLDRRRAAGEDVARAAAELRARRAAYQAADQERKDRRQRLVGQVREVLAQNPLAGSPYHVSGVPIVIADIGAYIMHDMQVFGLAVAGAFVAILWFLLRRLRWVLLPLATCAVTVLVVLGAMVACGRKITIPTSNLSSLLFIIAMVHAVQILVVYGESQLHHPERTPHDHIAAAVRDLLRPCLYTSFAMIAGFASLLLSDIRSIWDFGIFMSLGVVVSLAVSFLLIPAGLALLPPRALFAAEGQEAAAPVRWLAGMTQRHRGWILAGALAVIALSVWGTFRISVETKFIDYFRASTSFHRSMAYIDSNMGGTISLEVVLDGKRPGYFAREANLDKLRRFSAFLEGMPEVGKVMTVASFVDEGRSAVAAAGGPGAKGQKPLAADQTLKLLADKLPKQTLRGYITEDHSSARVFVRMLETWPHLDRRRIINDVEHFLAGPDFADLPAAQREVTGLFVLYTHMIESLIVSQIWIVLAGFGMILATICILFRSLRVGLIGVIPNVMHILFILGAMGWFGIHLDMITIMIASVSMGISVDCAIHYLCRYQVELARDGDYVAAMVRSHGTTGTAIWDTSVAIIVGFCVLTLSNFKPTIYFGVLTALAMASALFSALTLVPLAVLRWRPRFSAAPPPGRGPA